MLQLGCKDGEWDTSVCVPREKMREKKFKNDTHGS
jgi:hypothetical protein